MSDGNTINRIGPPERPQRTHDVKRDARRERERREKARKKPRPERESEPEDGEKKGRIDIRA